MKAHRDETTGRWHSDLPDVFDLICEKLRKREPFSFARYGDGEFNAIYGKSGANCDGHQYFQDLGWHLRRILHARPTYIVGLQPLTLASERWPQIEKDFPGIDWVDADCIHNASIDGRINKLLDALHGRKIIVVGPKHIERLDYDKYPPWHHVVIPAINCWLSYKGTCLEIDESLEMAAYRTIKDALRDGQSADFSHPVFLLCASMMSEVIIDKFQRYGSTFIDMGSVLDPYCNVKSRRYHHKLNLDANLRTP